MSVSDPSPESFSEQSNGNEDIEEGLNTEFSTPLQVGQPETSPNISPKATVRPYPSKRYAPHLEKCMGLAGRSSSRVANLRLSSEGNPSSPYTPVYSEDNANQSDSDDDLYVEKK
ncbi:17046_t:CDS:2, partial [Racocetra fulgida]